MQKINQHESESYKDVTNIDAIIKINEDKKFLKKIKKSILDVDEEIAYCEQEKKDLSTEKTELENLEKQQQQSLDEHIKCKPSLLLYFLEIFTKGESYCAWLNQGMDYNNKIMKTNDKILDIEINILNLDEKIQECQSQKKELQKLAQETSMTSRE